MAVFAVDPGWSCGCAYQLSGDELSVEAALLQQLLVIPLLHQIPIIEHHDSIGATDGGQAVGDHEGGAPFHQALQRVADLLFVYRV